MHAWLPLQLWPKPAHSALSAPTLAALPAPAAMRLQVQPAPELTLPPQGRTHCCPVRFAAVLTCLPATAAAGHPSEGCYCCFQGPADTNVDQQLALL